MNPVASWFLAALGPLLSAFAMWLVNRAVGRVDGIEKDHAALSARLHAVELQMAKELATKEDVRDIKRDMESFVTTMHEIRDMVIRLEERYNRNA